jgi:NAD(P)-dependent dehydrogenase (short-subunit alcohol dehydrogenase family)
MTLPNHATWFITGCSTGFGRIFAEKALRRGDNVVATARSLESLDDLGAGYPDRLLKLALDVTDSSQIVAAVKAAESRFHVIDILVNNAGYGYFAAIEEGSDADIRALFDANVFGLAAVTRAVLPGMRARGYGRIVNLSSIAGLSANPAAGYYAASKHAVEAISEALSHEGAPFGIKVLIVEPGPYRTDFAGRSVKTGEAIDAYAGGPAARNISTILASDGQQDGDPQKAIDLVVDVLDSENAPLRLILGKSAIDRARGKLAWVLEDIARYEDRSVATVF